jgi:hypothetical protein
MALSVRVSEPRFLNKARLSQMRSLQGNQNRMRAGAVRGNIVMVFLESPSLVTSVRYVMTHGGSCSRNMPKGRTNVRAGKRKETTII